MPTAIYPHHYFLPYRGILLQPQVSLEAAVHYSEGVELPQQGTSETH